MSAKHAHALIAKTQGSMVFFSTVAARVGFPMHSVIGTAKAGVEGLTYSLAAEFSPTVRVNCIAPSLVETTLAAPLIKNDTVKKSLASAHPLNRLGQPEDPAALAAFLLSKEATWITGQVFCVDGGRSTVHSK